MGFINEKPHQLMSTTFYSTIYSTSNSMGLDHMPWTPQTTPTDRLFHQYSIRRPGVWDMPVPNQFLSSRRPALAVEVHPPAPFGLETLGQYEWRTILHITSYYPQMDTDELGPRVTLLTCFWDCSVGHSKMGVEVSSTVYFRGWTVDVMKSTIDVRSWTVEKSTPQNIHPSP